MDFTEFHVNFEVGGMYFMDETYSVEKKKIVIPDRHLVQPLTKRYITHILREYFPIPFGAECNCWYCDKSHQKPTDSEQDKESQLGVYCEIDIGIYYYIKVLSVKKLYSNTYCDMGIITQT
jgi:hypothetical protein